MFVSRKKMSPNRSVVFAGFPMTAPLMSANCRGFTTLMDLNELSMSELQAALGHSQLKRLQTFLDVRGNNFQAYKERLAGVRAAYP